MLNEMGAFMSLARGDPLKPTNGMAKGFNKWKEQQTAKSKNKRMIDPEEQAKTKRGGGSSSRAAK